MNFYIKCGSALEKLSKKKGNFKTVLFELLNTNQLRTQEFQKAYPILITAASNLDDIDHLISLLKDIKKVEFSNKNLLRIMISELLFGKYKTIKGGGKLKKMLTTHKQFLDLELNKILEKNPEKKKALEAQSQNQKIIRNNVFIRIIENRTSIEELGIEKDQIKQNELIPNLFSINYDAYQKLRKDESYKNSSNYVVQSISSCLPAYFLCKALLENSGKITKKIDILDSCSAPGNKTSQLAEYWPNGTIFAIERDVKRYKLLCNRMDNFGFKNIECINQSFLDINPNDKKFKNVRFIMCDPTCSGTGMINNINELPQENESYKDYTRKKYQNMDDFERLKFKELKKSQLEILDHASKFPNLTRLSYSTCSIYEQENEEVVKEFVELHPDFKIVNLTKFWPSGGYTDVFTEADKCIRVDPGKEGMDGFFVCLFKKVNSD